MIKIKENCKKKRKWDGKENIPNTDIPEPHKPRPVTCRKESFASRERSDINISHFTDVDETGKKDDGQRCTIVLKKFPNESLEKMAVAQLSTDPCTH